jgi:hypothetical protein
LFVSLGGSLALVRPTQQIGALVAIAGFFVFSWLLSGFGERLMELSPLAGPLHLLLALLIPGYHPEVTPISR